MRNERFSKYTSNKDLPFLGENVPIQEFSPRGLTLTWYMYMCLPFRTLFHEIWYSDREFSLETKEVKLHKLGYFGQISVKSTHFGQNWVLFFQKWYTDGWEIEQKIGIGKVRFSRSRSTSTYDLVKVTPREFCCQILPA